MRKFFIKLLGGYHEGEVLNEVIEEIYDTVRSDDILQLNPDGSWNFEGKPLTREMSLSLSKHAESFLDSRLFRVLDKEFRYQVDLKLRQSVTVPQLENAKLLEYTWDMIKHILKERIENRLKKPVEHRR